ncbi:MAG: hypothetical protein JF611_10070 [Betaproteobacteria bacterium]|jgi:hypothetical protein|nr:hypothetical protein [Betaproteobacteria bacterium]
MKAGALAVLLLSLLLPFVARAHGGLLDLSVYDRTEGRRLPVYWHQGRAYVVGKPGNEYQVVLRNRLREEALAVVSVDGVNVVTGETAEPRQAGYVLSAGGSYDILGWRKSLAQTAAFYFTALPDSYAARTGRPENVGVIGIAVFRKKREPQQIAPSVPPLRRERSDAGPAAQDARLGTGHGRREDSPVRQVAFERATTQPAETVTLYYDSERNLVAQGVIRRSQPPVAPGPQPFPGAVSTFAPDPPG